jgi:KipI family sensor histidine kinase inhibitor
VSVSVRAAGDRALLVQLQDLDEVLNFTELLRGVNLPAVEDLVPAARTVLVRAGRGSDLGQLRETLLAIYGRLPAGRIASPCGEPVVISVDYDGPDLDEVAGLCGLTPAELISAHTSGAYRGAFFGFAPGFCYLTGGDSRLLRVPRRPTSRTRVPAGSVALAGEFAAVYPRQSPGGWQLIGSTEVGLWDANSSPPALIEPGRRVQFVDAGGGPRPSTTQR